MSWYRTEEQSDATVWLGCSSLLVLPATLAAGTYAAIHLGPFGVLLAAPLVVLSGWLTVRAIRARGGFVMSCAAIFVLLLTIGLGIALPLSTRIWEPRQTPVSGATNYDQTQRGDQP